LHEGYTLNGSLVPILQGHGEVSGNENMDSQLASSQAGTMIECKDIEDTLLDNSRVGPSKDMGVIN
jgi:hypothetical protein